MLKNNLIAVIGTAVIIFLVIRGVGFRCSITEPGYVNPTPAMQVL